ncbi:MAG: DUF1294 domain-containing protein [Peptoniphilaceae bacterium]
MYQLDKYLITLLLLLNAISFLLYFIDKKRAIKGKSRISEKNLIISSLFLSALGSFMAMILFKHKTKKLKFKILIPLLMIIQIFLIINFCLGYN